MKIEEKDKKGKLTLNTLTALITVTMYSVAKKTANSHFSFDFVTKTTLPLSAGGLVATILVPVVYISRPPPKDAKQEQYNRRMKIMKRENKRYVMEEPPAKFGYAWGDALLTNQKLIHLDLSFNKIDAHDTKNSSSSSTITKRSLLP